MKKIVKPMTLSDIKNKVWIGSLSNEQAYYLESLLEHAYVLGKEHGKADKNKTTSGRGE